MFRYCYLESHLFSLILIELLHFSTEFLLIREHNYKKFGEVARGLDKRL